MRRGFTLIELLVTIGIFAFMTALILYNYNSSGNRNMLYSMAFDMVFTIRQAQTYGISVKSADLSSPRFDYAYGVHFDKTIPGSFVLFVDSNQNQLYNSGETVTTYNLKQGAQILSLCAVVLGTTCTSANMVNSIDVLYKRPDPSPIIYANGLSTTQYQYVEVTIATSDGSIQKVIQIFPTGQLTVAP